MEVSGQLHAPATLLPMEIAAGNHWLGGLVGPRTVLDAVVNRKILGNLWELKPRISIVQPVAQHYTDWAIIR
jgi:hypothetical protein